MSDYKYLIFDAQYFLTRNFKKLCGYYEETEPYLVNGKEITNSQGDALKYCKPKFDKLELSKSFFWSIAKYCREIASCEKVILLWDKYPYYREELLGAYKDSRYYATEEDLEGLDPIKDAQAIINTKYEIDTLKIKQEAKWFIVQNFNNLGMKSFVKKGYEADDWAAIISEYLYTNDPNVKSAIVSIDSDWKYWIQPNIDYLRPSGEKMTYEEVYAEQKIVCDEFNLSLLQVKAYIDSLYGSHNDLRSTLAEGMSKREFADLVRSLQNSDEVLSDPELYRLQMKSFDIKSFPEFDNVEKSLYYLDKSGHIDDLIEYGAFLGETKFKVTPSYYSNFVAGLNPKLYLD